MTDLVCQVTEPAFTACLEAFDANFVGDGELGAACAIFQNGRCVFHAWGGVIDSASKALWTEDTVVPVFSVTKGVAAICLLMLVDAGHLELDSPVARYWPEFSAQGKHAVTVREALGHRAGVPVISGPVSVADLSEPAAMAARLADEAPLFKPASRHLYHAVTIGWITSELVRRVTGTSLGHWFRVHLAQRLGLNIQIGRTPVDRSPIATVEVPPDRDTPSLNPMDLFARPISLNGLIRPSMSGLAEALNDPRMQEIELAGANGLADAHSLARLYQAVIGSTSEPPLISGDTLADGCRVVSLGKQWGTGLPGPTWGAGLMLPWSVQPMLGEGSFGHDGAGGALAFAHAPTGVSFAYVRNRTGPPGVEDPYVYRVVRALADTLNISMDDFSN